MNFHIYNTFEWKTGSGTQISLDDLLDIVRRRTSSGCRLFIGTDSFISNKKVCFSTAVCLHGDENGGRYFYYNEKENTHHYLTLVSRITDETRRSIELAEFLMNNLNLQAGDIELHLDVSPFQMNNGTSRFSEMLKGYVSGYGLECKLKPDAWASQSIADKHSK